MKFRLLALLTATLLATAQASPATDALGAGQYAQAYQLAQQAHDAATASSAAAALITFNPHPSAANIDQALSAAQAAVKAAPNAAQPHLDLAAAYGIKASSNGTSPLHLSATLQLARNARQELEKAVSLEPKSGRTLSALSRYHAEAYARAGRLSGGNPDTARKLAAQALQTAGNDISVYVNVGAALLSLKDTAGGQGALKKALSLTAQNALERDYQREARGLLGQ